MTKAASHYVTDLCDECDRWRRTVEPFDDEYLCATCRRNHLTCSCDLQLRLDATRTRSMTATTNTNGSRRPRRVGGRVAIARLTPRPVLPACVYLYRARSFALRGER
jgi:hypothetical protein